MNTILKYIFSAGLLLSCVLAVAEENESDMIFRAMGDEMTRSMTDLQYEDYKSPFFISYVVTDRKKMNIQASLGAIIESSKDSSVYCGYKLLVGSYQLNDEKFSDKVNRVYYNDGSFSSLEHPNYYGIRRSLWLITNNSYKTASETYKNKCDLMEKEGLTVEDLKAPDYSQEAVVEHIEAPLEDEKSLAFFEDWARDVSLVFGEYTDVIDSDVSLQSINQTYYMLNSEGSKTQLPTRFYCVVVKAKMLSKLNKPMNQALKYYATSYDDLPSIDEVKSDVVALVNNLYALREAPLYRGKYDGPVLVQDEAVFYKNIIRMARPGAGLMVSPRGLINDKSKGLFMATNFTWEDMKGKRVIDKKLSVTAEPHLTTYNDVPLLGTVQCDNEAVLAPAKIELISNGILKNQLNSRKPTPSQLQSNGHYLPYYKSKSLTSQVNASVIKVESSTVMPLDSLYLSLVAIAEDEGLDHAIVIRSLQTHANNSPINVYKLDLETGKETLLSGANYSGQVSELKKVEAVGDQQILTNALVANQASFDGQMKKMANYPDWAKELILSQMGEEGSLSSFIYPNAFLIKSTTVNGVNNASKSKPRVVPSPLAAK